MMHVFEIVAEPVRRRLIEILAVGEHPVGILNDVIAMEFSVSRSAVSHHLKILREEGVVSVAVDEALPQSRMYRLDESYLHGLDAAVGELFHLWQHRYGTAERRAPIHPAPVTRTSQSHRAGRKGLRGHQGHEHGGTRERRDECRTWPSAGARDVGGPAPAAEADAEADAEAEAQAQAQAQPLL